MLKIRHIVSCMMLATLLGVYSPAQAAGRAMPVQWKNNDISWQQMQAMFNQNPGFDQFNIQFPNNASWNVTPSAMQAYYQKFLQQAKSLGYGIGGSKLPDLAFSSLGVPNLNSGIATLPLPVQKVLGGMDGQMSASLRELRLQQLDLPTWLPDWFRSMVLVIYNGLMNASAAIHDKVVAMF